MDYHTKNRSKRIVYHILVCAFGFVMIYPLLWMLMSSFKPSAEIFRDAKQLIPSQFIFRNYSNGWAGFGGISFSTFFGNSVVIATTSTVGATISSAFVAFGFSRCRFRMKKFWFACMLVSMMLPFQILMIPQFILFQRIGWVGTFLPLIVPYFFGQAFFIFLNMQFIEGIPKDLDEAAKIDGCSIYGIFVRVVLPLIVPALITSMIFSFIWRWDDFMASFLYLNNPAKYPANLALKMFSDPSSQSDWGAMFAMATLSLVPIFVIFVTLQKYLVEGISTTGLKG